MSEPPVRSTANARWDCHSCGSCCRLYELGPVEIEVIRDLEAKNVGAAWAPAADGWYERRRAPDGRAASFFTHRDGHCVFLMDDQRCAIHATFGAAAKPGFCREYPFHLADRGDSLALIVRPSCASHHLGAQSATPVAAQAAAVLQLPRATPVRRAAPERVNVWPGLSIELARAESLEDTITAASRSGTSPAAASLPGTRLPGTRLPRTRMSAQRHAVRSWLAAEGIPQGDDDRTSAERADPERARLAAGAILEGVRRLMAHAAADQEADPQRRRFAIESERLLAEALPRLRLATTAAWTPETAPAMDAYFAGLTESFLLARWYLGVGGVAQGLGFLAVQEWLASTGADLDAAAALVVRWTRLTENAAVLSLLRRAEPALLDVFHHG